MFLILYNPFSRNGANTNVVEKVVRKMKRKNESVRVKSLLEIEDKKSFRKIRPDTKIIIVGGDGTLNRVANELREIDKLPEIYLYKAGTGNDFRRSLRNKKKLTRIDQYLINLPSII